MSNILHERVIVNIRGCNGAGKSSIPTSMMDDPEMYVVEKPYQGKKKVIATVFPSYKWLALGSYANKTGGLDGFPNTDFTKKVFWYVLKKFPDYNIILEGVIASTVFSTYADLFKNAKQKYPEDEFVVVYLMPPVETCIKRIYKRNGGKPIKEQLVYNKWRMNQNGLKKFKEVREVTTIEWDNTGCRKKDKPKLIHQMELKIYDALIPF